MRGCSDPCRICGGSSKRVAGYEVGRLGGYWSGFDPADRFVEIRRCSRFGSYVTARVPPPARLAGQYSVDWDRYYTVPARSPERKAKRCLAQLARFVPAGARVLDVGGGNGAFALKAAARYDSWVQDFGLQASERLSEAGVTVLDSIDDAPAGTFHAITLWDVYEHVWPHAPFIAAIGRALSPDGLVLIEVPSPTRIVPLLLLLGRVLPTSRRETVLSMVCDLSHLQLMKVAELEYELGTLEFEVVFRRSLSELSYAGVVYAARVIPFDAVARRVGALFERRLVRRAVLGDNKTFVVARPRLAPAPAKG